MIEENINPYQRSASADVLLFLFPSPKRLFGYSVIWLFFLFCKDGALLPNNPPLLRNNRALLKKVCLIFCRYFVFSYFCK